MAGGVLPWTRYPGTLPHAAPRRGTSAAGRREYPVDLSATGGQTSIFTLVLPNYYRQNGFESPQTIDIQRFFNYVKNSAK